MFKILKYYFVITIYKKAKKQFLILAISLIIMILSGLIINDVMTVASDLNLYFLIVLKWIIIFLMMIYITFNFIKILKLAMPETNPIIMKYKNIITLNNEPVNIKKETILKKDKLFTESDNILHKYIRDKK